MKNILFIFSFILLTFGTACNAQKGSSENVKKMAATEFQQKVAESTQILDVRTPGEYADGHLANALNINIADADFKDKVAKLDKNKQVCVYCQRGMRSAKAAGLMSELGFKEIYDLEGGIEGWTGAGLKVEK
jgi:rhodanese-related sulfurtransferase